MRLPSLSQRRLRIDQSAQFELPFAVEGPIQAHADESDFRSERRSESLASNTLPAARPGHPALQESKPQEPHSSTRKQLKRKPPTKTTVPLDGKLLVSREQAAAMLSISVRGVDYFIATKRLSTRRIGTRVLIPIEDVHKFACSDHPERMAG